MGERTHSIDLQALRTKAESLLTDDPSRAADLKDQDLSSLLQDLSVYQIELEMQNDELRKSQADAFAAKVRYADLYDSAPVGYLTVDTNGVIVEANLAVVQLLGIDRTLLIGAPLSAFLHSSVGTFHAHIEEVFKTEGRANCEVVLRRKDKSLFPARLESISFVAGDRKVVRTILTDITGQKQADAAQKKVNDELGKKAAERTAELEREVSERKKAEKALTASQAQLEMITNTMGANVAYCSRDLRYLWVSKAFARWLGYEPESLIGHPLIDAIGVQAYERIRPYIEQVLEGKRIEYEAEVNYWTNGPRWINAVYEPTRDAAAVVDGWVAVVTDITGRKRAEESLLAADRKYQALFDNQTAGLAYCRTVFDERGKPADYVILDINPAYERNAGVRREQVVGKRITEVFPGVSQDLIDRHNRVAVTGKSNHFEIPVPTLGKWFDANVFCPERGYFIAISYDITGRKRAEEELRKSRDELELRVQERTGEVNQALEELKRERQRLYDVLETLPVRVCLLTPDYHVPFANRAFREVYGEAEGRCCYDYCLGLSEPCSFCEAFKPLETGQPHHWGCTSPDGKAVIDVYEFPFTDTDGSPMVLEMSIDVTEQKRMEEQLRQSHKMEAIGTLAGGIAHDFNNMLAVILGNAELAIDEVDEVPRERIKNIVRASMRSRDLVKQILTFSRRSVEQGKVVEIVPLLKETYQLLRASFPSTIRMRLNIRTKTDTTVFAQPSQVQQIIVNLARNAADAMGAYEGTLTVGVSSVTLGSDFLTDGMVPGRYIKLTVKDTGTGIAPDVQKRMYEPFYTTKEQGKGTGMGLALVYGIVKAHKGVIEAESELGKGSKFTVLLPQSGAPLPTEEDEEELSLSTKQHVLFVDDEPAVAEMAKAMLERMGYVVTAFTDASEALNAFIESPDGFDLVITDQTMPGITGIDLAREVLDIREGMPIILCTGYSEWVSSEEAQDAGVHEFVMKPVTRKEMGKVIKKVFGKRPSAE